MTYLHAFAPPLLSLCDMQSEQTSDVVGAVLVTSQKEPSHAPSFPASGPRSSCHASSPRCSTALGHSTNGMASGWHTWPAAMSYRLWVVAGGHTPVRPRTGQREPARPQPRRRLSRVEFARLIFEQGGRCARCKQKLQPHLIVDEHLNLTPSTPTTRRSLNRCGQDRIRSNEDPANLCNDQERDGNNRATRGRVFGKRGQVRFCPQSI